MACDVGHPSSGGLSHEAQLAYTSHGHRMSVCPLFRLVIPIEDNEDEDRWFMCLLIQATPHNAKQLRNSSRRAYAGTQ